MVYSDKGLKKVSGLALRIGALVEGLQLTSKQSKRRQPNTVNEVVRKETL